MVRANGLVIKDVQNYCVNNSEIKDILIGFGFDGYYIPKQIRVKVRTKIRLSADPNTLRGCMKTVVIQNYGSVTTGKTPLEFVADKIGTFRISCPMSMGSGQLIVEDASSNVSGENIVLPIPKKSGCGCGS